MRRRLGATRWGVFQDVTVHGKFLETFLVPSWQGYLLQRAHYTRADIETEGAPLRSTEDRESPSSPASSTPTQSRLPKQGLPGDGKCSGC